MSWILTQLAMNTYVLGSLLRSFVDFLNVKQFKMLTESEARNKLYEIHNSLIFKHGSLLQEYDEQVMAVMMIDPDAVVLEVGGNIGRNSCTIGKLLRDSSNLVVVESDPETVKLLQENRDLNNLSFAIVSAAISKSPLYQIGWLAHPWDGVSPLPQDAFPVPTVQWSHIVNTYGKRFDTLVLDCEGAFYYILKEEPTFLEGIKTIILENDFIDIEHKHYVNEVMTNHGFVCIYTKEMLYAAVCPSNFYEIWQKQP